MATIRLRTSRVICVGLLALTLGCAPAYHSYQCECSCVPYGYCPPAPLPYTAYCGGPTPVASSYSSGEVPAADPSRKEAEQIEPRP